MRKIKHVHVKDSRKSLLKVVRKQCKPTKKEQELVDNASKQSFPASDPPPWTLGVDSKQK